MIVNMPHYGNQYEFLSKPLLTLETIQHLRFPFAFSTFWVLGIMAYRSGISSSGILGAIRIEKKQKKKGIALEISHRFAVFFGHLMTGIMNQTLEVLTNAPIYQNPQNGCKV